MVIVKNDNASRIVSVTGELLHRFAKAEREE